MKKKLFVVAGTRPEMIKVAPVMRELQNAPWAAVELLLTGQHLQVVTSLLNHFEITAHRLLPIKRERGSLSELINQVAAGLAKVIAEEEPDGIIVQGDTTSAMAAALCGFSDRVPVFHVEAGLRSFNLEQPFPEEFNRRVISLAAALHFAPTELSRENLLNEGIPPARCHVVGNTGIDALLWTSGKAGQRMPLFHSGAFRILATCHRRESWDSGLEIVCRALAETAARIPHAHVLFPVHPNPKVKETVKRILDGHPAVTLCPPMDYEEFCHAMSEADVIVSDSGGVQEEALALGKPTLVTRWVTERPEVLEWPTVQLVGPDFERIVLGLMQLHNDRCHLAKCSVAGFPFGRGDSSQRIGKLLQQFWGLN